MPNTPNSTLPYPAPTDPVAQGAAAIQSLAVKLDGQIQAPVYAAAGNPLLTLTNSLVETDLLGAQGAGIAVPANLLGTKGVVELELLADAQNNDSSNGVNLTLALYYGGTKVVTGPGMIGRTNKFPLWIRGRLFALGATSAQGGLVEHQQFGGAGQPTTLQYLIQPMAGFTIGTAAIDSTTPKPLRLTWAWGTASANFVLRVYSVSVRARP